MVLVAGATYGVNPRPPFLTPTSNDWALDRGAECALDIGELFDLGASGRMGRMFLSGLQIDRWGNANVTMLGNENLELKLPGGGGGCNLSCDAQHVTLWTTAHRCDPAPRDRRRYRLVKRCDFVTSFGHRTADGQTRAEFGHRGQGPEWLITDLGIFDFNADGHLRLRQVYPDTTVEEVAENSGFDIVVADDLSVALPPSSEVIGIIRGLDPLGVHLKELRPRDRERRFAVRLPEAVGAL
jgi:glutaconate CoA-transferase subunit B